MAVYIQFILDLWLVNPPEMSHIFIIPIMVFSLIDAMSAPMFDAVHATGRIKVHQILMASIKILNIPIIYFLLKGGAPLYIAYVVWASINMVCCIVRVIYMGHLIQLPVLRYFKDVFGSIIAVLAVTVPLPLWYYFNSVSRGVATWKTIGPFLGIFLVIYALAVFFIGLRRNEKARLLSMLRRKKKQPVEQP